MTPAERREIAVFRRAMVRAIETAPIAEKYRAQLPELERLCTTLEVWRKDRADRERFVREALSRILDLDGLDPINAHHTQLGAAMRRLLEAL